MTKPMTDAEMLDKAEEARIDLEGLGIISQNFNQVISALRVRVEAEKCYCAREFEIGVMPICAKYGCQNFPALEDKDHA